jgi:hypothetical protein
MVDKDVTCMGLAIQRLDAWQHGAEREGDWLRGRKLDPTRVEVPARGACGSDSRFGHCVRLVLRVASCRYCMYFPGGFMERRASPTFAMVVFAFDGLIDSFSAAYGCRLFCWLYREVQRMSAGEAAQQTAFFTLTKEEG